MGSGRELDEFEEFLIDGPPEGWKRGHVTLHHRAGKATIEAWRRGAFAVHRVDAGDGHGRLTHAPTGLQIWTFATTDDAAQFAESIEGLTDWSAITAKVPHGSDLFPKVRDARDKFLRALNSPRGE